MVVSLHYLRNPGILSSLISANCGCNHDFSGANGCRPSTAFRQPSIDCEIPGHVPLRKVCPLWCTFCCVQGSLEFPFKGSKLQEGFSLKLPLLEVHKRETETLVYIERAPGRQAHRPLKLVEVPGKCYHLSATPGQPALNILLLCPRSTCCLFASPKGVKRVQKTNKHLATTQILQQQAGFGPPSCGKCGEMSHSRVPYGPEDCLELWNRLSRYTVLASQVMRSYPQRKRPYP